MARRSDFDMFLGALESAGGKSSNGSLRAKLGWTEDKYWRVHSDVFDEGLIEKGRGYGGSVILLSAQPGSEATEETEVSAIVLDAAPLAEMVRELDLYDPALSQLQTHWSKRRQFDNCHIEVTALQGRRDTGGSWSRPDIIAISSRKFEFLPEKIFELESFEIKPEDDVSVVGVMEALAHREASTRSYVIYHTNGREFTDFAESTRIEDIAGRHGVGVYAARDIKDFDQWAEITPAKRGNPEPEALDTFLRRSLSDEAKSKLRKWF